APMVGHSSRYTPMGRFSRVSWMKAGRRRMKLLSEVLPRVTPGSVSVVCHEQGSHVAIKFAVRQPPFDQWVDGLRGLGLQHIGLALYQLQQMGIAGEVSDAKTHQTGLLGAQHLPWTANLQILLGDVEAVIAVAHDAQALLADSR